MDVEREIRELVPDMDPDDRRRFSDLVFEELTLRVGMALTEGLTDEQLDEFDELSNDPDGRAAADWLDAHVPDHRRITLELSVDVFDELARRMRQEEAARCQLVE